MPKPDIEPLYFHKKMQRMIERYNRYNGDIYIFTGPGNACKSINYVKSVLKDPKLAPYDSDNDEYIN